MVNTRKIKPWLALLAIYAAMLALHGFSESDLPDFIRISRDMLHVLAPEKRQFLYSSPLNFAIGWMLHLSTMRGFYLVHGVEIVAMLSVVLLAVRKKFPNSEAQTRFLLLLSLTPLWLITLKWIGKPDPVLISMLFLAWAYPGHWRWLFVLVMVIAHREMGTVMALFLFAAEDKPDYRLILPILAGHGLHYIYEHQILDHVPVSRVDDITIDLWMHPKEVLRCLPFFLFGSLSWYWLVVAWKRPPLTTLLGFAAAFGIAMFPEDFTRDFILMALPVILLHLEKVVKDPASEMLTRFTPLGLMQIQIAAMGVVFKPNNIWIDWLTDNLHDQLLR